jgi:hypothetical protein
MTASASGHSRSVRPRPECLACAHQAERFSFLDAERRKRTVVHAVGLVRRPWLMSAVNKQQKTLNAKLRGHYQYYGRRTNYRAIRQEAYSSLGSPLLGSL